jgi:hypothetical protein
MVGVVLDEEEYDEVFSLHLVVGIGIKFKVITELVFRLWIDGRGKVNDITDGGNSRSDVLRWEE